MMHEPTSPTKDLCTAQESGSDPTTDYPFMFLQNGAELTLGVFLVLSKHLILGFLRILVGAAQSSVA
jgi:hypothetical protein